MFLYLFFLVFFSITNMLNAGNLYADHTLLIAPKDRSPFNELPDEIKLNILKKISGTKTNDTFRKVACVCRNLYNLCRDNSVITYLIQHEVQESNKSNEIIDSWPLILAAKNCSLPRSMKQALLTDLSDYISKKIKKPIQMICYTEGHRAGTLFYIAAGYCEEQSLVLVKLLGRNSEMDPRFNSDKGFLQLHGKGPIKLLNLFVVSGENGWGFKIQTDQPVHNIDEDLASSSSFSPYHEYYFDFDGNQHYFRPKLSQQEEKIWFPSMH